MLANIHKQTVAVRRGADISGFARFASGNVERRFLELCSFYVDVSLMFLLTRMLVGGGGRVTGSIIPFVLYLRSGLALMSTWNDWVTRSDGISLGAAMN